MSRLSRWVIRWLLLVSATSLTNCAGCSGAMNGMDDAGDGSSGDGTIDGRTDGTTNPDSRTDGSQDGSPDGSMYRPCSTQMMCRNGERCVHSTCVPDLGACTSNDDCPGDSYCDTDMRCVPYGVPPSRINDPECQRRTMLEGILPTIQCEWTAPPDMNDPTAQFRNIYSSPVVGELNFDHDARRIQPSIVAITWDTVNNERRGLLRVWDGRTCSEQLNIGNPNGTDAADTEPAYGAAIVIADLDRDVVTVEDVVTGHPEIVTMHRVTATEASVIAYNIQENPVRIARSWVGRRCDQPNEPVFTFSNPNSNHGPTVADLDDDGFPEVIVDQFVFDHRGCLLNPDATFTTYVGHGLISVIADVDADGSPELVDGTGVYGWDRTNRRWTLEPYWQPTDMASIRPGNTAVADFGTYPTPAGTPSGTRIPEIVVVSAETPGMFDPNTSGTVRIQTITGQIVFGPITIYTDPGQPAGHGGPPTASDFDGDGQVEFAAAANRYYSVYDPDCYMGGNATARPGGRCNRPAGMTPPDGVLWGQPSQDFSSSITGSSIFDFDADGASEAVYRDECYLRVYRGATGEVLFSSAASSGTGYELPTIVDVDGDFATEIVVVRAANGGNCPARDPLRPDPNVDWQRSTGFVVLRDPQDRWAPSRPIWNQHAYSVTNVTDDGRIPRTSETQRNWEQQGLNNFRQNVQGALGRASIADLTVAFASLGDDICSVAGTAIPLQARVCNRGTNPVADGAPVSFVLPGQDGSMGQVLCTANTTRFLLPGECIQVECRATIPTGRAREIIVTVDPEGAIADCHTGNNRGIIPSTVCPG